MYLSKVELGIWQESFFSTGDTPDVMHAFVDSHDHWPQEMKDDLHQTIDELSQEKTVQAIKDRHPPWWPPRQP